MTQRTRPLLPIILALVATLNGCSSGSSSNSNNSSSGDSNSDNTAPPSAPLSSTLSGSAVKGLMSFAPVSVFPILEGVVGEAALVTGETDTNGNYQLSLENYNGPAQVQLSIDNDTLMICDAVNGCGEYAADDTLDLNADSMIDFGDKFHPNDPDLVLNALVPSVQAGIDMPVQITPLTHAAAAFAMNDVASLDAAAITRANLQLASVLGLTIDILNTPPVDITAIPEGASDGAIEYAALLGALASMATDQELSDSDMIAIFVEAFVANDGQLIQNSDTEGVFTLQDLYAGSGEVLTLAATTSETNLNGVQAELAQNELTAGAAAPDSTSSVELPEDTDTLSALEAAKSLVSDVRTWGNVINQEAEGPIQDVQDHALSIETALDIAAENLQLKQGMENLFGANSDSETGVDSLLAVLEYALDITTAVLEDGQTETSYDLSSAIPGLDSTVFEGQAILSTGTVSVDRANHQVDINGIINGQTVSLHFESSDLDSESTTEAFVRISETIPSQLENDLVRITLSGGISATANVEVNLDETEKESVEVGVLSAEIIISEKTGANPSTFTGTLVSIISRDLPGLNATVAALPLSNLPDLEQFPGIPSSIQTDLYTQHLLRVTGTAAGTDELLDGTIFWSASAAEIPVIPEFEGDDDSELESNFIGFKFTGELSNGLGDLISGEFEFTLQNELDARRNVTALSFVGTIATQSGDSFEGSFSLTGESPVITEGNSAGELATDEYGDEYFNLSNVTLTGAFNFSTGESILASAIANSDNAATFIPESDPANDETESNFHHLDLAISFNAQLIGLPLARFTLSAERTAFEDGIANIDISYGGSLSDEDTFSGEARRIQFALDSTADLDDLTSNRITISDEQGITITLGVLCEAEDTALECEERFDEEGTHGAITVNDEKVADLDLVDGNWLIRYSDGTFESLF